MSGAALHWRDNPAPGTPRLSAAEVLALVRDPMQAVETRLLAQMESPMGRIPEVGGHLLGAGGKRLRPLLLGVSRKSFIEKLTGVKLNERLPASLACATLAVESGANIIRAHDVAETVQTVRMAEAILQHANLD